jgi:hypothetical protein
MAAILLWTRSMVGLRAVLNVVVKRKIATLML